MTNAGANDHPGGTDDRGVNGQDSQTEEERLPSDPTQGPPAVPQPPLAHSAEVLVDTLAELAAGSHGAFQRQESVMPSESESEREDEYEQVSWTCQWVAIGRHTLEGVQVTERGS